MADNNFYYKKDRLNQLRGFCMAVKHNSVNKAARELGVEPATVSKQISALERDTGLQLFDRETVKNRIRVTNVGMEFYKKSVEVLQEVEGLFNYYLDEIYDKNNKKIRLATHHTALNYLIPKYIESFKSKYPDTSFEIYNIKINEALERLDHEDIDLLIHVSDVIPPQFSSTTLFDFKPIILINKKNSLAFKDSRDITFDDLSKQNMIMLDRDNIISGFVELCDKYGIKGNINIINGDWESVRNLVKLNVGVHLYSEIYNKFEEFTDDDIISKNVEHLFPSIKFQLIIKKGKILNDATRNFIETIKKYK